MSTRDTPSKVTRCLIFTLTLSVLVLCTFLLRPMLPRASASVERETRLSQGLPAGAALAGGPAAVPPSAVELPPDVAKAGLSAADWAAIQRQIVEYEAQNSEGAQPAGAEPEGAQPAGKALHAAALGQVWAQGVTEVKKLLASDGAHNEWLGRSVAVAGDTIVVGADGDDDKGDNSGSAYVFHRNQGGAGNWGEVTKLTASDGAQSDSFGYSVAVAGDTIVVGAFAHDSGQGSAYVFDRNQGGADNWGQVAKVTASDGAPGDEFGWSVAVAGDTIVVGAEFGDNDMGITSGSAYVFHRNEGGAGNWGQVTKLTASDGEGGDLFGGSVAVAGDTIVVGADWADGHRGSAYVFDRNQGGADNWGQVAKLTASDGVAGDGFGLAVAASGDTAVLTAPDAAYVFCRNQGGADNWGEVKKLTASDGVANDSVGWAVAVDGDTIVVRAAGYHPKGSAYVFRRNQGGADNWGQVCKLTASDGEDGDSFGYSVAVDGDTIVVGALWDDDKGYDSGSAYVFHDDGWPVSGEAVGDHFGISVGTAGDVDGDGYAEVIVGASGYDGNRGRAYVYRGGASGLSAAPVWTATGSAVGDSFGESVGTAGDVDGDGYADVIIGAPGYNSDTGRVYIYRGGASGLSPRPVFTATGEARYNQFGRLVGTAGDVDGDGYADVIVGAHGYDGDRGRAYVYRGGAGGVTTTPAWTATGEAAGDQFGICVGTAGDAYGGDGYADVIVGARGHDGGTGRAYVYRGGPGGLSTVPVWTATGEGSPDWFGDTVATAGDVNGDGYADVIVGAFRYNDWTGRAYVYHGGAGGLSATPAWTGTGEAAWDRFGVSVATAGDVDGDGYADVIVGASRYNSSNGRVYVYGGSASGLSAEPVFTATGEATDDELGRSVGTAGDVDGDGYADIVIGAFRYEGYTGRAYLYRGGAVFLSKAPVSAVTGEDDDWMGASVGTAGDVDGDGYSDVIVGAYEYSAYTGRVDVYRGGPDGLSTTPIFSATGEAWYDYFGHSVGTAGDVDGDGYADVIIGVSGYTRPGRVYVYSGGPGGLSVAPVFTASGAAGGIGFGRSVGTAGDVDGDGYSDIIIACSDTDRAYVYRGGPGGLSAAPAFTVTAVGSSGFGHQMVGTAGDVDGDGYADVIIGAPHYNDYAGRAYVYRGGAGGISPAPVWTADGEASGDWFGHSVATAGDVDGDGYSDVVIGAWGYEDYNTGRAYVYRGGAGGLSARPVFTATGEGYGDHFGCYVGTAGDVDGDGYADVIISAHRYNSYNWDNRLSGRAYAYRGGAGGLSAAPAWTATGHAGELLGISVGTAGDVDGDGFADVVIGASGHPHPAYVFGGNGGGGRQVLPHAERSDGSGLLVQPWDLSYREDGFHVQLNATSPRGRERVKLQVEACPPGVPFGDASCSTFTSPTWEDVTATAAGVTPTCDVRGLARDTLYRWRARVLYAPFGVTEPGITAPPNPAHGPWRRFLGQAQEADLRTGSVGAAHTLYLPMIRRP